MNIGYRVYFSFRRTNQSVQCDIAGIWRERKFHVRNLNVERGKFGRKIFPKYYEDRITGFDLRIVCSGVFTAFRK